MPINISNGSLTTVQTEPVVEVPRYLILKDWEGKEVGRLSARFDFSHIPPEAHARVFNYINQGYFQLNVGELLSKRPPPGSVALTPELAPTGGELSEAPTEGEGRVSLFKKLTQMFREP
jgi:hypothetical protein